MTPRFRSLVARLFGRALDEDFPADAAAPAPRPTFEIIPPRRSAWRPQLGESVWVIQRDPPAGAMPYDGPAAVVAIGMGGLIYRVRPDAEGGQAFSFGATLAELHPMSAAEDVLEILRGVRA